MNRWLEGQQNEWMDGCCCLTSRSSGSEPVSLLCLLDRALGTVDGGSRNNLSSCNVFTLHWASPTNACASFAVIALEKPRPWDTAKTCYEREKPLSEWHFEQILTVTMIMLFSVITVLLTGIERGVGVILKRCQLGLEVIELHVWPEELRLVDRRWHKLNQGVVFECGLLYKLRKWETVLTSLL